MKHALLAIAIGAVAARASADIPPLSTIVRIPSGTNPEQVAGLAALQSDSSGRLAGWPWMMPSGQPMAISKADYMAAVEETPGLAYYIDRYATGTDASPASFYEALPVFLAMYRTTGESRFLDYILSGTGRFTASIRAEIAALGGALPHYQTYWHPEYAWMYQQLLSVQDTPQGVAALADFTSALGERADAWGAATAAPGGVYNMSIYAAFWFDLALHYNPQLQRRVELRAYADAVWNEFQAARDHNEDDAWYGLSDLLVLDVWYQLRGIDWAADPESARMFRSLAYQVGNDGTVPGYGDGNRLGNWFAMTCATELVASRTRDPVLKWLAHRTFWAGRDHLADLTAGVGYANSAYLAMAYFHADDTLPETAPAAGVTVLERRGRDLAPPSTRYADGRWFTMRDDVIPSKTIIRAGSHETDPFVILQTGQQGGHSHTDAGNVLHFGGNLAYYLFAGALRSDSWNEEANVFLLRQRDTDVPWAGTFASLLTTEDVSVPVAGQTASGGYARIHVQEAPGVTPTAEGFAAVKAMVAQTRFAPERAIGYKNWPVRLDRSVLLLPEGVLIVRDATEHVVGVPATMGQNWTFGELGKVGNNWINTWPRRDLSAYFGYRFASGELIGKMHPAAKDLLLWFAPQSNATLEIERLDYSRFLAAPEGVTLKSDPHLPDDPNDQHLEYLNTPFRAWYSRSDDWAPQSRHASTTVMVPHDPEIDAAAVAGGIALYSDSPTQTVIRIRTVDGGDRLAILQTGGGIQVHGSLETDAEAVVVEYSGAVPTRLSFWHATFARLQGGVILSAATPVDADVYCTGATTATCVGEYLFGDGFD